MLVEHFPVSVGIFLGIFLASAGIVLVAMPLYRPVDGHRYAASDVRSAFSVRGLPLPRAAAATGGVRLTGDVAGLYVLVAKRDLGPRRAARWYERRIGNVLVHYGGADRGVLVRVRAAAASLAG